MRALNFTELGCSLKIGVWLIIDSATNLAAVTCEVLGTHVAGVKPDATAAAARSQAGSPGT